jgi:hypothetical protein
MGGNGDDADAASPHLANVANTASGPGVPLHSIKVVHHSHHFLIAVRVLL